MSYLYGVTENISSKDIVSQELESHTSSTGESGGTNKQTIQTNMTNTSADTGSAVPKQYQMKKQLFRVYSESERSNFHETTGHRLYDDNRYRPVHSEQKLGKRHYSVNENDRPSGSTFQSFDQRSARHPSGGGGGGGLISPTDSSKSPSGLHEIVQESLGENKHQQEEDYNRYFTDSIDMDNECIIPLDKLPKMKLKNSVRHSNGGAGASSKKRGRRYSEDMYDEYIPDFDIINNLSRLSQYYDLESAIDENEGVVQQHHDLEALESENIRVVDLKETGKLGIGLVDENRQPSNLTDRDFSSSNYSTHSLTSLMENSQVPPIPVIAESEKIHHKRTAEYSESIDSVTVGSQPKVGMGKEFEIDLGRIPDNFDTLPYSQRKKTLMALFPNQEFKTLLDEIRSPKSKLRRRATVGANFSSNNSSSLSRSSALNSSTNIKDLLQQFNTASTAGSLSGAESESKTQKQAISRGLEVMGYRLGKIIGHGAWGVIRECHSLQDENNIKAMKIVRFKHHAEVKKSVLNEVHVWKQLDHPNILSLYRYQYDDHAMFCLMDKIYGGTLYDVVAKNWHGNKELSVESRCRDVVRYALQVVSALKYMHEEKNIIHGDLKLENCLITHKSDRILLCDFGMAQCRVSDSDVSALSSIHSSSVSSMELPSSTSQSAFSSTSQLNEMPSFVKSRSSASLTGSSSTLTPNHLQAGKVRKIQSTTQLAGESLASRPQLKSVSNLAALATEMWEKKNKSTSGGKTTPVGITSFHSNFGPAIQSIVLSAVPSSTNTGERGTSSTGDPDFESHCTDPDDEACNQIGSLPYAAPELVENTNTLTSCKTDVWALGCMLYCMVMGKLPFQHEYEPRLRLLIESGKYNQAHLDEVLGPVSKHLCAAIKGCLIKNIEQRWTMEQVEEALAGSLKEVQVGN